jgi:hypothetical protein
VPNGIVALKNRTLSPAAKLFIEHAREAAKPLGEKKIVNAMSTSARCRRADIHR